MSRYDFPARKEEIDGCPDIEQLRKWKHQFELTLTQMAVDFGGIENAPEKIQKYYNANKLNLRQIDFRIAQLSKPVSSVACLKRFHDKVRELFPSEYAHIVELTKASLGCPDGNWEEMIKPQKQKR